MAGKRLTRLKTVPYNKRDYCIPVFHALHIIVVTKFSHRDSIQPHLTYKESLPPDV
ncbi:conserved hypothetical protein [Klebsiella pneumoniae]|nr:hypothetical protein KP13_04814 [Klebsiella pneumoniae subsp. pneumoniae Kp13]EJK88668.1 hypothetical protein UUU_25300 [Klebsiella pneumoniae subsp. pneumoniae DSM 30104 = JCM 1662 = NBRC 14940]CTQ28891.1 conserved hypothetical protein [Klebsiella pneumoniae]